MPYKLMSQLPIQLFTLIVYLLPAFTFAADENWVVTKQWEASYEQKFSEFVAIMGESNCNSLQKCLSSKTANPLYINKTPLSSGKIYKADCADLPFALRMYFAWMEGLPFDYVSSVNPAKPEQETSKDIRYTKYGNKPKSRIEIAAGRTYNGYNEMSRLNDQVSTAMYRMHYEQVSDFYPASLDLESIRPGTVVYDPAGHAAIIYKIEPDGRIKMMDAHPDQSITRITFDKKFARSRPDHGAGFKNWRTDFNLQPASSFSDFSTEQFASTFSLMGQTMDYYDYVRTQMAGGHLQFNPVNELKNSMLEVCANIQDRVRAVSLSIRDGIDKKPHPAKLPENIYGTSGEWEEYSTPSRDARLKVAFVSLMNDSLRLIQRFEDQDPSVVYTPTASAYSQRCQADDAVCFLIASMKEAYETTAQSPACQFEYTKSSGPKVSLNYNDVLERLFKLSFDPYDCIELRWGAEGEELASCKNDASKMKWYSSLQGLRNQIERTYEAKMDFDVHGVSALGVAQAPAVDLLRELEILLNQ
jgi:hypothetical protein